MLWLAHSGGNHCHFEKMGVPRVGSQGPSPPLTSSPPLPGCRACSGGADPGAGGRPGARPEGPSPPPLHGRGFARGAAAAGSGAHGGAPRPHQDHLLPRVHPSPGGPASATPGGPLCLGPESVAVSLTFSGSWSLSDLHSFSTSLSPPLSPCLFLSGCISLAFDFVSGPQFPCLSNRYPNSASIQGGWDNHMPEVTDRGAIWELSPVLASHNQKSLSPPSLLPHAPPRSCPPLESNSATTTRGRCLPGNPRYRPAGGSLL